MSTPEPDPVGPLVTGPAALPPSPVVLSGNHCTLTPLTLNHAPDLFTHVGGLQNASLWSYLPRGPYDDLASFTEQVRILCRGDPFFAFAILSSSPIHTSNSEESGRAKPKPVGIICLMTIVPSNRSIEIGHVVFGKTLQRTTAATEAVYLLLKYSFEDLHYSRVEWKANNLNEPSKRAALRLGFSSEGLFKKHMVVKGRRRDTAWFSVTDDEWVGTSERVADVKLALERWLDEKNFDAEGRQRRKLEDFRAGA